MKKLISSISLCRHFISDNVLKKAFEEYCSRENEKLPSDDELSRLYPLGEKEWASFNDALLRANINVKLPLKSN